MYVNKQKVVVPCPSKIKWASCLEIESQMSFFGSYLEFLGSWIPDWLYLHWLQISCKLAHAATRRSGAYLWRLITPFLASMILIDTRVHGDRYSHRCLQAQAYPLPGLFKLWVLISQGLDAKTRGHQHIACTCTDICIVYSVAIRFPQLRIKCGIAKSCLGTHTALQAPMDIILAIAKF